MKLNVIVVLAMALGLGACSSTANKPSGELGATANDNTRAVSNAVDVEQQKLQAATKALAANSIYFDYNQYTLKSDAQAVLQKDAAILTSTPKLNISLEGNTDDRGSREFNLALGQKRAEAVKKALQILGVPDVRMEAVSYGMERPRASCEEESCWSQNRRVDITTK